MNLKYLIFIIVMYRLFLMFSFKNRIFFLFLNYTFNVYLYTDGHKFTMNRVDRLNITLSAVHVGGGPLM